MNISDILLKFDSGSRKDYYSFETFILNLLKHHIESQDRSFEIIEKFRTPIDAIAREGFDDFQGLTLIDVVPNINSIPEKIFERIVRSANELGEEKIENFIIISKRTLKERVKQFAESFSDLKDINFRISVYGPEDITTLIEQNRAKANEVANNLFSLKLESTIAKKDRNWKVERELKIKNLTDLYAAGQITLFLGAGVSSSAGMPGWNKLLDSLFINFLNQEFDADSSIKSKDIKQIVDRLNTIDDPTSLMAARYIRKGFTKDASETKEFYKAIGKSLYELRNKAYPLKSELIKAIGSICTPKMTGSKVKAVVTYNFDDLIEREFEDRSLDIHSIYNGVETCSNEELPIYHVHGFLPEDETKYEGLDRSTLVFSEEGYHQIYLDSYHWSNLVQLNNLKDNTCIMIGLSMTDPNLRRLLEISSGTEERSKHYAFLRRISDENFCYKKSDKGNRVKALRNTNGAKSFLNTHHVLNEEIMDELGVTIIWYEEHDELPDLLNRIKNG